MFHSSLSGIPPPYSYYIRERFSTPRFTEIALAIYDNLDVFLVRGSKNRVSIPSGATADIHIHPAFNKNNKSDREQINIVIRLISQEEDLVKRKMLVNLFNYRSIPSMIDIYSAQNSFLVAPVYFMKGDDIVYSLYALEYFPTSKTFQAMTISKDKFSLSLASRIFNLMHSYDYYRVTDKIYPLGEK